MAAGNMSAATVVKEFERQFEAHSSLFAVMPRPMVAELREGAIELTFIGVYTEHQGKGYAGRALCILTALCDANGLTIELNARPEVAKLFPDCRQSRSVEELVAWYGRNGFVDTSAPGDNSPKMVRYPR